DLGTHLRFAPGAHDRNQRHVLFAAAAGMVRPLARRHAARVYVQRQGHALHYPPSAAARYRDAPGELPGLGTVRTARKAGPHPVAISAFDAVRPGTFRALPVVTAGRH